jgi:hypothetical protein
MTVELDASSWGNALTHYFRNWGKRIKLEDLIALDSPSGAYLVVDFVMGRFDEDTKEHAALREFLREQHGGRYDRAIVNKIRANPRVARVLRQLLRPYTPTEAPSV